MSTSNPIAPLDAVIVGAGFAGLYMLHRLRQQGFNACILEAGSGAGGTWFWNRYPGARCDIQSMEYSDKFSDELSQEWDWSERYATLLYSCNSWYLGANVPGKPRVFMPYVGFPAYADTCREVVAQGYTGFQLSAA